MNARFLIALVLGILLHTGAAHAGTVAERCVADLDDARAHVGANDAGAAIALADHPEAIARAYDAAHTAAARVRDDDACWTVLHTYLGAWRAGHLDVVRSVQDSFMGAAARPDPHTSVDPRAPRLQVLDKDTLLLTLPTFHETYRPVMERFLADQRNALQSHPYWIVDVRNNDGGSDSTFDPLLPWLLDGAVHVNTVEWFATPANIKAHEDVCAMAGDPAACAHMMAPIVATLRAAPAGSFVARGAPVLDAAIQPEPQRPSRVAVLIDQACASSCEQFVLEARTGFRVKVLGRPTGCMLDVSNLRPHTLPSGRLLFYATSRSTRLPAMRIDGIGIAPDILLEKPADAAGRMAEARRVQRWLEGGALEDK